MLSRGIIGSIDERVVVASPLFKQHFDLKSGRCIEQDDVVLKTYDVRVVDGHVEVRATSVSSVVEVLGAS